MRLLLTSNGISNNSINTALEELVGKPPKETKIAFIPTAAFPVDDEAHESKDWLVDNLRQAKEYAGFIDIISLADLTREQVAKRLEYVDIIMVGGGNAFYLSYWMQETGLFDMLPDLLSTRVYVGISAGSMIASKSLRTCSQAIKSPDVFYADDFKKLTNNNHAAGRAAQLVDFVVRPHYNQVRFPGNPDDIFKSLAREVQAPLYALDDNSALKIVDDKIDVISEGTWKLFEPET